MRWAPQHVQVQVQVKVVLEVLLVLAGLRLSHAAPDPSHSFIENDSIVFPEDGHGEGAQEAGDKLAECLEDDLKIPVHGDCFPLLTTANVCPEGSWLVLDLQAATRPTPVVQPVCRTKRCPSKSNYWPPTRRCVYSNESASLCPPNNVLKTDWFGDGMCACKEDPVHARDKKGVCHALYSRGPCGPGQVWLPGDRCSNNTCPETTARFPDKLVVPWPNGRCYAAEEQGPCPQGQVVRVNKYTMRPGCIERLAVLHLVNPPCSGFDHQGNCKQPVTTPQNYFYSQIASQAKNKKSRKADPK